MTKWTATFLLLSPILVYAQVELKNVSLLDPDIPILYRGVENFIEIEGMVESADLDLKSSTAKIITYEGSGNNRFIVKAGSMEFDTLSVFDGNSLIATGVFAVKTIGDPIAQLGDLSDSIATVVDVLENPIVKVVIHECSYDHQIRVHAFNLEIVQAGDTLFPIEKTPPYSIDTMWVENPETGLLDTRIVTDSLPDVTTMSNSFTEDQIRIIKELKKGARLNFSRIKGACPSCSMRLFDPFSIRIK